MTSRRRFLIEYRSYSLRFRKGMKLVAYTAGLTDITGPDGRSWRRTPPLRLRKPVRNPRHGGCDKIFSDAVAASAKGFRTT
jgi:hypothetical protein